MKYATPEAFKQALEARIRSRARAEAIGVTRLRQVLVFERFLARVFAVLGDRVIAKGGAVLELRLRRARTTRDVDLRAMGSPDELFALLVRAAELDLGDHYTFRIEPDREHPEIEGDGMIYQGRRYRCEARLAGKIHGDPFGVDVGPREAHVAEKLHAYTLPRSRPNTRVKDLPDLALLARTGPFDGAALRRALEATFSFRRTHPLPARTPDPPVAWSDPYRVLAEADDLPWRDLAGLVAAVRAFLDPVLAGAGGRWDPTVAGWRELGSEQERR